VGSLGPMGSISCNNIQCNAINMSGNLGIYNTSPQAYLHLGNCDVAGSSPAVVFGKRLANNSGWRNAFIGYSDSFYFCIGDWGNTNAGPNTLQIQIAVNYAAPQALVIGSDFNKIYTTLESLDQEKDIILDYSDDKLLEVLDNIANEEKDIKDYYKYQKAFNKFKNNEKLKDKHLLLLDKHDFQETFMNVKFKKPKYTQYRVNIVIFDDLLSDQSAFKRNSKICNLTIKCRHRHCNMLFTTQYPRSIPPVIRTNTDIWIFFKFSPKERIVDQIYNEIS
jgi:hypothetical protein